VFRDVVWGDLPKEKAVELFVYSDVHLAKRQVTWLKRNKDINWFDDAGRALQWFNHEFGGTLK
jgi:tRNA A37 N6-isopentenylltransferase MiaA